MSGRTTAKPAVRLRHLARQLHSLEPAPLYYFLQDIDGGRDLWEALEDHASLGPLAEIVKAYAVTSSPFLIAGGRR